MTERTLTDLARLGFVDLEAAEFALEQLERDVGPVDAVLASLARAADPDQAVSALRMLAERDRGRVVSTLADADRAHALVLLLGASSGFAEFYRRWPGDLEALRAPGVFADAQRLRAALLAAVDADARGVAQLPHDAAVVALRREYRRQLAAIAVVDLAATTPTVVIDRVMEALTDLADAALEAGLAIARADVIAGGVAADDVLATDLVVIAMGKTGARELNYVSDVDVVFAAECAPGSPLRSERMIEIATRLARGTMRALDEYAREPPLWTVDANLRPEGKDGALVRTVASHRAYYERWASGWEFQALLKARPAAGSMAVGERYLEAIRPLVWASAARENFVEQVQRMRGRVTESIPPGEVDWQVKLGPGGLRDVEFTVQLLQLVHGRLDDTVRQRGTLEALQALSDAGYVGRAEAAGFAGDYRFLRLLEHRLQLRHLRRTHLMPADPAAQRSLARAIGIEEGAAALLEEWNAVRIRVRGLHERLFYRPLLAAVARTPDEDFALTSEQAEARLAGVGFARPREALAHIAALTAGVRRRSLIQRHLLPVVLQWLAEGADPDGGLLAFRRLSEHLGDTAWYLRMLRDSSFAAQRLAWVLSHSRFAVDLLERFPEAVAWLESDDDLRPRDPRSLDQEAVATVARHPDASLAAAALRTLRRREVLRLALGALLGTVDVSQLGVGLSRVSTALLRGVLRVIRRDWQQWPEFAIIAMGSYGGEELGFGSDADLMYVYRPLPGQSPEFAQQRAERIVALIKEYTEDQLLPFDVDLNLRPEGKNGPVVRSFASYRAYYERWALTWEAQALLRARGVVGDKLLVDDFMRLVDDVRYPASIGEAELREIRRIKARVENERIRRGADPRRHLKLGPGSLSDVEWLVQYLQLQHGDRIPDLRTPSTLTALSRLAAHGLLSGSDMATLRNAWILASRVRSAVTLWGRSTSDLLPSDRQQLEGVARILEYPPGSASALEEDYLRATRLARTVFERRFYGEAGG